MGDNDRGWRADLEFLVTESKMPRVLEKSYSRKDGPTAGGNGRIWESVEDHNDRVLDGWVERKRAELEAKKNATR